MKVCIHAGKENLDLAFLCVCIVESDREECGCLNFMVYVTGHGMLVLCEHREIEREPRKSELH